MQGDCCRIVRRMGETGCYKCQGPGAYSNARSAPTQAAKKAALKGTSASKLSKVRTSVSFYRCVLAR